MKIKYVLLAIVTGFSLPIASALANQDLENCRWQNGTAIDAKVCAKLRELDARDRAANEKRRAELEAIRQREAEMKAKRDEQAATRAQALAEARENERIEEEARIKKQAAEDAQYEREERARQKKHAQAVASKKEICGDDYGKPRIGMTLARAQECVGKFQLESEVNRRDGVVSTYRSGRMYLHIMDGHIVSWGHL